VILDEATSSMDSETDKLMQRLIRDEFTDHTILTIAHRMDIIMDSDLILVLDAGKLVEAGAPSELAEKEGGIFRALYTMSSIVS
jgi:ATP-binding cassette subfamily C (CFTR/MRP) protein 1